LRRWSVFTCKESFMRIVLCSLVLLIATAVSGMAFPQHWHSSEYRHLIREQARERAMLMHEHRQAQRDLARQRSHERLRMRREADAHRRELRQSLRLQRSFSRRHRSV
jgi:hypothetical protein